MYKKTVLRNDRIIYLILHLNKSFLKLSYTIFYHIFLLLSPLRFSHLHTHPCSFPLLKIQNTKQKIQRQNPANYNKKGHTHTNALSHTHFVLVSYFLAWMASPGENLTHSGSCQRGKPILPLPAKSIANSSLVRSETLCPLSFIGARFLCTAFCRRL